MPAYEMILLIDPNLSEDERKQLVESARKIVTTSTDRVETDDDWGDRKLAYEIDHRSDAHYHYFQFTAQPDSISELSKALRITDGVLRHRIVKVAHEVVAPQS